MNNESKLYPFPVSGRIHVPSKIAGTAAWINENTLQLDARFVEAIHSDKITCAFNGDKISVSFLNRRQINSKTNAILQNFISFAHALIITNRGCSSVG